MKCLVSRLGSGLAIFLVLVPLCAHASDKHYLTSAEVEKLRNAQNPSERIKVYLSFEKDRLDHMEAVGLSNRAAVFRELLNQYISIDNEMKDWIQYQYDRDGDMRKGLRSLLDQGPKQLEMLHHFQHAAGPDAKGYSRVLRDAIADMDDTLNGATEALAAQNKKFPAMKENAKAEARALKKEQKEQRKLNKKERKLRNRHHKNNDSDDSGEN